MPLNAVLLAVFINILWGGNPVAIKITLEWLPPLWAGFFRFLLGIMTVALYASLRGIPLWPARGEWRYLATLAVIQFRRVTIPALSKSRASALEILCA